jgi:serine/threonine protein kinase
MELLTQGSLRDYLKKSGGKLPPDEALELVDGLLSALMAAHRRGIVHRDIKPDNLMLANIRNMETDTFELGIKVLDFGASLLLEAGVEQNAAEGLLGTPYYMSPEQAAGMPLDQRTDLYSTAVVLYELLSGKLPHAAEDVHSLVYAIATEEAKPIAEYLPNITRPYREFFAKALAMDPERRFRDAEEMRQELRKLSRRLAGKVRNTALYMASENTGPVQTLPPRRQDTKPLVPFRKVLDSQLEGQLPPLSQAVPQDSSRPGGAGAIALGAALGAALGVCLQAARFGSLAEAGAAGVALAAVALAGLGAGLGWWLPSRMRS